MPRSIDHIVATHEAATALRRAGKPIWQHKIDVADIWNSDLPLIPDKRDRIVAKLRASSWFTGCDEFDDLNEIVEELAEADTGHEFDRVWDALYDLADIDRVWIGIF